MGKIVYTSIPTFLFEQFRVLMLIFWINAVADGSTHIDYIYFFLITGKYEQTTERNRVFTKKLVEAKRCVSGQSKS
jgi:hypothetical protein